ncbi:MAG: MOP flippase family protein [Pseudomonadota bacterium]|nr:MOP flippase family protein [Pseudomonadota bacterium]
MADFKHKVTRGVRWSGLNTLSTTAIHFIELAVLARLLGAEAYGLMAIVSVITGFVGVFADLGLSGAVIQRLSPTREELSTLYWINVAAGLAMFILFALVAPLMATAFGATQLRPLLSAAALTFVISSFGAQFSALILKELRFDILTKFNIASALIGMSVSVALALYGFGVWALIWGSLSATFSLTMMRIAWGKAEKMLPFLHFNWNDGRRYLSFGVYLSGQTFVNYINFHIDQLLVGYLLGPIALGYYNIASRLAIAPFMRIHRMFAAVAFPAFSLVQDDQALLKRGFMKMIGLVTSVNAPVLVGMAALAPLLVPILLGEKWRPAIPLVQILAFYSLFRSFGSAAGSLIIAKGKAKWMLYWNLSLLLLVPPTIFAAAKTGDMVNVCYSLVLLQFFLGFIHYRVLIRKLIGPCFTEYAAVIAKPIVLALCMGALMSLVTRFVAIDSNILVFAVAAIVGTVAYIVLSFVFQRALITEAVALLFGRPRKGSLS